MIRYYYYGFLIINHSYLNLPIGELKFTAVLFYNSLKII